MRVSHLPLHQRSLSLDHESLTQIITTQENILIIQDLDGVCMGLVKDPLTRVIEPNYLKATKSFDGHFYVLTNGEHIGKRGINLIVERAFKEPKLVKQDGLYLPGLAAGGVQWQDRYGNVKHPGVSEQELSFLAKVPQQIESHLQAFFHSSPYGLKESTINQCIQAAVLDNKVSPTANLNVFHEALYSQPENYRKLQQEMQNLMKELLNKAQQQGLGNSFFIHYAPNLGQDSQEEEIMQLSQGQDSGTTDFQFMLRGAIKEVGVLVILNHYYYRRTGKYPLGENFNVRQAPQKHLELIDLVKANFDPKEMPTIVGIGDTVTSKAVENKGEIYFRRGGSDRGFLQLIQELGQQFNRGNIIVYIDSSDGEVKNRQPVKLEKFTNHETGIPQEDWRVVEGPGDRRDLEEPLTLNLVFPGGYQQYIKFFQKAAQRR